MHPFRPSAIHQSIRARIRVLEDLERALRASPDKAHYQLLKEDPLVPFHLYKPRVYCASPLSRRAMWQPDAGIVDRNLFNVVSTWHASETVETDDADPYTAYQGWLGNLLQLRTARYLLVYAEHKDRPNGTLVEVGAALAHSIPVLLVGNHEWGSWCTLCQEFETLREALDSILITEGVEPDQLPLRGSRSGSE